MKPYRFHRQADEEFTAAAQYYAAISPALGQRFYITIHELLDEICASPTGVPDDFAARSAALPSAVSLCGRLHRPAGLCVGHRRVAFQTAARLLARAG